MPGLLLIIDKSPLLSATCRPCRLPQAPPATHLAPTPQQASALALGATSLPAAAVAPRLPTLPATSACQTSRVGSSCGSGGRACGREERGSRGGTLAGWAQVGGERTAVALRKSPPTGMLHLALQASGRCSEQRWMHAALPGPAATLPKNPSPGQRSYMEDRHTVIPDFQIKGAPSVPRQVGGRRGGAACLCRLGGAGLGAAAARRHAAD